MQELFTALTAPFSLTGTFSMPIWSDSTSLPPANTGEAMKNEWERMDVF